MKKSIFAVVLLFGLLLCCNGCNANKAYTFMQTADTISAIDIIYVEPFFNSTDYSKARVIRAIDSEHWEVFLSDFSSIPCKSQSMDPYRSTSGTVIRITYTDGCCEVISAYTGLQINTKGECHYPFLRFDIDAYRDFINKWKSE